MIIFAKIKGNSVPIKWNSVLVLFVRLLYIANCWLHWRCSSWRGSFYIKLQLSSARPLHIQCCWRTQQIPFWRMFGLAFDTQKLCCSHQVFGKRLRSDRHGASRWRWLDVWRFRKWNYSLESTWRTNRSKPCSIPSADYLLYTNWWWHDRFVFS